MYISPTIAPHDPPLPLFMVPLYQPYPLPRRKTRPRVLGPTKVRDMIEQADDLSEEEREFEEKCKDLKARGYNYMIPLGKTMTLREERIDAESASDTEEEVDQVVEAGTADGENDAAAPANTTAEDEADEEQDLDNEIEDLDEQDELEDDEDEEEDDEEDEEEPDPSTHSPPEDDEPEGEEEDDDNHGYADLSWAEDDT